MSATVGSSPVSSPDTGGGGPPAIEIAGASKSFRLPKEQYHTLKERAMHAFRNRSYETLRAVQDVNVDIAPGEFFGIVGRNGSGKSTLLKCLAGIYRIDAGELRVRGRLAPFIELGVGFNPELTARDNAIINAIMLGLTRKQAEARFDEIVAFAELEEFMDLRLKNYSSGMHVRLAFSVAVQVDADILLIDEVLAVGDANFQQKCFDQFAQLKAAGRTIVFVTHDMSSVERFCDRAMLMDRGRVVDVGDPVSIARQYNELNFRQVRVEAQELGGPETLRRAPVAELRSGRFVGPHGELVGHAAQGEPCTVELEVVFHDGVLNPQFAVSLQNEQGHRAFATSTPLSFGPTGQFAGGDVVHVALHFDNWLSPGRYSLTASVTNDGIGAEAFDLREDLATIVVYAPHSGGGLVDLPSRFEITPASARPRRR